MPSSNNHRPGSVGAVGGGVSLSNRGRFDTGWEVDVVVLDTDVVVGAGELVAVNDRWVVVAEEEEEEEDEGPGGDGERSRLFDLEVSNVFSVSTPFCLLPLLLLLLLLFPSLLLF